jgi:hypothetical protein
MPEYTDRWGLSLLGPGDTLAGDGYKFSESDILLVDRLLQYAAEQHHHSGATGNDMSPRTGPNLAMLPSAGAMASSSRYYYVVTLVDDLGNETAPSPVSVVDTPAAVSTPGAPALSYLTGSGTLLPGNYSYVLSAYKGANNLETKATNSALVTIPGSSPTNHINLILPNLPIGADGLNVYRKSPSGMHYLYITSIPSPTTGDSWIDDGTIEGDCDRSLPGTNRTSNTAAVRVTYPGATPVTPEGWGWRIYRSTSALDWSRSFLADVAPQGATPVTPITYTDVGSGTQNASPPTVAQVINAPSKVQLTDAAEVEGVLPPGAAVVPHVVTFSRPGPVTETTGTFTWTCDFDQADIISCRAYLGVDSEPASQDVIVDVNTFRPAKENAWISIYDDGAERPTVPVGSNFGTPTTPVHQHLVVGDSLNVDVDQAGGGATPTDTNLTVNILLYVQHGSVDTSYDWTES